MYLIEYKLGELPWRPIIELKSIDKAVVSARVTGESDTLSSKRVRIKFCGDKKNPIPTIVRDYVCICRRPMVGESFHIRYDVNSQPHHVVYEWHNVC